MKETILSKFKRLAVAMFAALCVGNVWAATYLGDSRNLSFDAETKTISFTWNCYLKNTVTDYKLKAILEYGGSTTTYKVTTKEHHSTQWYVMKFDKTLDDFELGDVLRVTFSLCYGNDDANIDNEWGDDSYSFTVDTRGVLTSDCTWDVDTKKFLLSGKVAGYGITGVKVKYKVSDAELTELPEDAVVENAEYDSSTSTYKIQIPYENEKSYLNWSVYAVFNNSEEKEFKDPASEKSVFNECQNEDGYIAYTWTGAAGDNLWSNSLNWDENLKRSLKGVPGYVNYANYYTSIACFTNSTTVNLGGGTYRLWDTEGDSPYYRGLELSKGDNENMKVTLTNGTVQVVGGSTLWVGANGVTLEFGDKCVLDYYDSEEKTSLCLVGGSTVIFSGNSTQPWVFKPIKQGNGQTTFIVKDGAISSKYRLDLDTVSDSLTVRIENATWTISTQTPSGLLGFHDLGARTVFRDGERQAQLKLSSCSGFTLSKVYDFKLPDKPFNTPYITGKSLTSISDCTIEIDVTDLAGRARVPLMCFDSLSPNANGWTSVEALVNNPDKLVVTANGKNVKTHQRARLEWDETAKTLYYSQDPIKGFRVIVR